jgi:F0F1-type ATP synthase membrane subunit b/b'
MTAAGYEAVALWSQVIASVLFVIVVVWVWMAFIRPAVIAAEAKKNADLLEGERKRNEAREEVSNAQRRLESATSEIAGVRERAQNDARRERDRILADARIEGERLVHNANGELARGRAAGREQYRDALLRDALELTFERAKNAIDEKSNFEIVRRVLDAVDSSGTAA